MVKGRYQYWDNIVFQITRLFMIQCLCLWHLSYFLFSCIFPILFDLPHIKCLYLLSKQSNMIVFFIMNSQLEGREITFILILNFWKTKNKTFFSDFLIHPTSFKFSSNMWSRLGDRICIWTIKWIVIFLSMFSIHPQGLINT